MSGERKFVKVSNSFPMSPDAIELSDKAFRYLIEAWCGPCRPASKRVASQLERQGFMKDGKLLPHPMFELGPLKTARPPIDPELRRAVYERDGFSCVNCLATDDLSLDHIHPWSLGGPDTFENFQTLCRPCNSSKGDRV